MTGTVAQVRDDDTPLGAGGVLRQRAGDIFVGKAMKTVAFDAFGRNPARQAEHLGDGRLAAMEGGVEAGDLRYFGQQGLQRPDAGDIVRFMQGCQRNETVQVFQYLTVNNGRLRVKIAAMDDTMADGDDFPVRMTGGKPFEQRVERLRVADLFTSQGLIGDAFASLVLGDHPGDIGADPVDLP